MESWDPYEYMRFSDERTRLSVDLASRIGVESPARVIDLGCGPCNSTRVLRARWPEAHVVGLDSSSEMIDAARSDEPNEEWLLGWIRDWAPDAPFDVVFSNAALQWVLEHGALVESLFRNVAPGGAFAFQIFSATIAAVRELIHGIALDGSWTPRMAGPLGELTMESPSLYYDHLASDARSVDIWETEYFHVMDSPSAIVDWISSTGLRPFLAVLESDDVKRAFLALLQARVAGTYRQQRDGHVLFPFKRTFVIAYR